MWKDLGKFMPFIYILEPQQSNTAANGTQLVDQKLNVGAYCTWGIAPGVFLEACGQAFQKSPGLHLQPQAKCPKFHPKPQNLANFDKAWSNDLR